MRLLIKIKIMTQIKNNFLESIGNTPLIKLKAASEITGCHIFGKAEYLNPGGSVKDRAALALIKDAQEKKLISEGGIVVEGTAGNTGIGLCLLGNSLGGHIALVYSKYHGNSVNGLVLTGSSGLYENSMGDSYPQRGNYDYIKKKSEEVFFDPKIATKEIVDEVFETVNNRNKLIRTLAIAKSAIRHNMSSDLPKMNVCTAIIWGENDTVTPPNVANEFHKLLPLSTLFWIKECGHAPMMEHPDKFNSILLKWLNDNKL